MYEIEYERLRSQIVGTVPRGVRRGVGLALLLREGVTAWLRAMSLASGRVPPVAVVPSLLAVDDRPDADVHGQSLDVIPPTHHAEAARLLAGLVLSARAGHRSIPSQGASV